MLFLVPAEFKREFLFLASLLVELGESILLLLGGLIFLSFQRLQLFIFPDGNDFKVCQFSLNFVSLILNQFDLSLLGFDIFVGFLLRKSLFSQCNAILFFSLNLFRLVFEHPLAESVYGLSQVDNDLVLISPLLLKTQQLFVCSFEINSFPLSVQLFLQFGNLSPQIGIFLQVKLLLFGGSFCA